MGLGVDDRRRGHGFMPIRSGMKPPQENHLGRDGSLLPANGVRLAGLFPVFFDPQISEIGFINSSSPSSESSADSLFGF